MRSKKKEGITRIWSVTRVYKPLSKSFWSLLPLSMVFIQTSELGWGKFFEVVTSERVVLPIKISFVGASLLGAF